MSQQDTYNIKISPEVILDDIYHKHIKNYNISKNDFYNFAFRNSSLNNSLSELYKKYNE